MGNIRSRWVRYRDMGGPRYLGKKENGKFLHVYNPAKPWGVWSQVLGVIARCEGRHDTVVMYDETGVTAGAFQWTFKSGRLQRLLQFFKSVPHINFESDLETSLFEDFFMTDDGGQVFESFGFRIEGGKFVRVESGKAMHPGVPHQQKTIVDTCMGRRSLLGYNDERKFALSLCTLFATLFQEPLVQAAMVEYAKIELKQALDVRRKPLKSVGGTINHLIPSETWGSPIPAIFFNLNHNSPAGSYLLYKRAMEEAAKKGVVLMTNDGYELAGDGYVDETTEDLLEIIWRRLCKSRYADWGFKSKQYLASKGKNPPRILNIGSAIKEFYGPGSVPPYIGRL